MKGFRYAISGVLVVFILTLAGCKKDKDNNGIPDKFQIDSTKIGGFFEKHPDFKDYQKDINALYKKQNYQFVWYDESGRLDFAEVLYDKARKLENEGLTVELPYKKEFADLFSDDRKKPNLDKEMLISAMYFFYAKKVYEGIDPQKSKQLGWYLPREKKSYVSYLDELIADNDLLEEDTNKNIALYYNLKKGLQKYQAIAKNGGWGTISLGAGVKTLKLGDNSPAVAQVRKRLAISGELKSDSASPEFDKELKEAVMAYERNTNSKPDGIVTAELVKSMNIPVAARIKTIIVNMERCRWLSTDVTEAKELISVNIPAFKMTYIKDGKTALESNVVVGDEGNKTVVFSGKMSYLVFSPYWNIPKSIITKEVTPGMEKDKDYLEKHNMEWNDGNVRQKPGKDNSLGLVKFMFPNSNNIYLHDTPAKSLFNKEDRALSHGCVRVEKARELAILLLDEEKNWDSKKIDEAMNSGTEVNHPLKRKIPVYIAYFTAVANEAGNVTFYDDVYSRDNRLATMLYKD